MNRLKETMEIFLRMKEMKIMESYLEKIAMRIKKKKKKKDVKMLINHQNSTVFLNFFFKSIPLKINKYLTIYIRTLY